MINYIKVLNERKKRKYHVDDYTIVCEELLVLMSVVCRQENCGSIELSVKEDT